MKQLDQFFRLSQRGTTLGREIRGGCTTFCSMVYLILVIPGLLSGAGMDFEQVMTATCLIAAAGSIVSGLVSNLPFALAPGLGFTTLFTHTLCQKYGCTWQQALALVLLSGVLFLALSLSPLRERLNDALPMPFKFALSAGVGLFLTLSGLINAGLITADDNLVDIWATLAAPEPLLALLGIFVTAVLVMKKVPGALMLGMAFTVVLGIPLGVTVLPQTLMAAPELSLAALKPDFTGLLALGPIPLVSALLSLLVSQYFDALGTLLGVAGDAKLTDTTGDLDRAAGGHALLRRRYLRRGAAGGQQCDRHGGIRHRHPGGRPYRAFRRDNRPALFVHAALYTPGWGGDRRRPGRAPGHGGHVHDERHHPDHLEACGDLPAQLSDDRGHALHLFHHHRRHAGRGLLRGGDGVPETGPSD